MPGGRLLLFSEYRKSENGDSPEGTVPEIVVVARGGAIREEDQENGDGPEGTVPNTSRGVTQQNFLSFASQNGSL